MGATGYALRLMALGVAVAAVPQAASSQPGRLASTAKALRFSLPPAPLVGPPPVPALLARHAWQPIREMLSAHDRRSEDRNQFAAVRALRIDRGRSARTALDAKLELTLTGDLGGFDTRLGVGGLPRMVQRALVR